MTKTEQHIRQLEYEAKYLERILDTSEDDLPDIEAELCAIYKELQNMQSKLHVSSGIPASFDAEGFAKLKWEDISTPVGDVTSEGWYD